MRDGSSDSCYGLLRHLSHQLHAYKTLLRVLVITSALRVFYMVIKVCVTAYHDGANPSIIYSRFVSKTEVTHWRFDSGRVCIHLDCSFPFGFLEFSYIPLLTVCTEPSWCTFLGGVPTHQYFFEGLNMIIIKPRNR